MICTQKQFIRTGEDGTKWWQVVLTADADPDTLNLTGADVDNLNDELGLAAGSVLITPSSNYIAFADGVFTLKSTSGGGGGGGGGGTGDLVSVTISPELETSPTLSSCFPINYADLTDEEKADGVHINLSSTTAFADGDEFTITATAGAGWKIYAAGQYGSEGGSLSYDTQAYTYNGAVRLSLIISAEKADDQDVYLDVYVDITY